MAKTKQKKKNKSKRVERESQTSFSLFALPPIQIQTPLEWYPKVENWTEASCRVRWETLTGTPMTLHWNWTDLTDRDSATDHLRKELEKSWQREMKSVEEQSQQAGVSFEWTSETEAVQKFFKYAQSGMVREYLWEGRPGFLTVAHLERTNERRAFIGAAICPSDEEEDPRGLAFKILQTLSLSGTSEPLTLSVAGLNMVVPSQFKFDGLRGNEGQLYADFQAKSERLQVGRTNFSDLHLCVSGKEKVWAAMVKQLFDRGQTPDPILTLVRSGIQLTGRELDAKNRKTPDEVNDVIGEHEAGLYVENRKIHIRMGDSVMRKMGRRFSGGAAALIWNCAESHSIWGISVRTGDQVPEELVRERLETVHCHDGLQFSQINWRPFTEQESISPENEKDAQDPEKKEPTPRESEAMRRRQLRVKVKGHSEVRMEPYEKDGTGALIYKGAPAKGFMVKVLGGAAKAEASTRHLALDVVGRRVWEMLENGNTVQRMVADLSAEFGIHPVEAYPKLMAFLKPLGERGLIEVNINKEDASAENADAALG